MKKIISIFSVLVLILGSSILLTACNKNKNKINVINVQLPATLPAGIYKVYDGDMSHNQISVSQNNKDIYVLTKKYYEWTPTFKMVARFLNSNQNITLSNPYKVEEQVEGQYTKFRISISDIDWNTKDTIVISFEGQMDRLSSNVLLTSTQDVVTDGLVFNVYRDGNKMVNDDLSYDFTFDKLQSVFLKTKIYYGENLRIEVYSQDQIKEVYLSAAGSSSTTSYKYERNNNRLYTVVEINEVNEDLTLVVDGYKENLDYFTQEMELKITYYTHEPECKVLIYKDDELVTSLTQLFSLDTFDLMIDANNYYDIVNYLLNKGLKIQFNNVEYEAQSLTGDYAKWFKIANVPSPFKDEITTFVTLGSVFNTKIEGSDEYFENHKDEFVLVDAMHYSKYTPFITNENEINFEVAYINGVQGNYITIYDNDNNPHYYTAKEFTIGFMWELPQGTFEQGRTFKANVNGQEYTIDLQTQKVQEGNVTLEYNDMHIYLTVNNINTLLNAAGLQSLSTAEDLQQIFSFEYIK